MLITLKIVKYILTLQKLQSPIKCSNKFRCLSCNLLHGHSFIFRPFPLLLLAVFISKYSLLCFKKQSFATEKCSIYL